jgi:hypothetical protein
VHQQISFDNKQVQQQTSKSTTTSGTTVQQPTIEKLLSFVNNNNNNNNNISTTKSASKLDSDTVGPISSSYSSSTSSMIESSSLQPPLSLLSLPLPTFCWSSSNYNLERSSSPELKQHMNDNSLVLMTSTNITTGNSSSSASALQTCTNQILLEHQHLAGKEHGGVSIE